MNKMLKRMLVFMLILAMSMTTLACAKTGQNVDDQNDKVDASDDANKKEDADTTEDTDATEDADKEDETESDSPVVMDKNITVNEDGSVTITNPDAGTDVFVGYELAVKAGQKVTFDVESTHQEDIAIWLFCNGIVSTDKEYYANWHSFKEGQKQTITIDGSNIRTDMECFQLRFRHTFHTPGDCVITVSNLQITNP